MPKYIIPSIFLSVHIKYS